MKKKFVYYPDAVRKAKKTLKRITMNCLGVTFKVIFALDKKYAIKIENLATQRFDIEGRMYLQIVYSTPCTKTGIVGQWKGRKFYLSEYMTQDEIVKTAYVAFEAAVKHEIMEGFKVDGKILFNPHINFEDLLKVSDNEITR